MTNNVWNTPYPNANGEILIGNSAGRPSAANITGDASITITNGAGSIQIDNNATGGGDLVKISSSTAAGSSSIDFTGLSSTYFLYIVVLDNIQPADDEVVLWFRTSTDNGSNFDDGASDYAYNEFIVFEDGTRDTYANGAIAEIEILGYEGTIDELGDSANEKASGMVYLFNPSSTKYTFMVAQGFFFNESTDPALQEVGGYRLDTTAVNAIRFVMNSGNIASGKFTLYGVKAS